MTLDLIQRMREVAARRRALKQSRPVEGITGRVHVRDSMLFDTQEGAKNYVRSARSAIENLEIALELADREFEGVTSCLDMGSGYGRVLRQLCQRVPPARITACDIDPDAVRFCQAEFGVHGFVSASDLVVSGRAFRPRLGRIAAHPPH